MVGGLLVVVSILLVVGWLACVVGCSWLLARLFISASFGTEGWLLLSKLFLV